MTKKSSRTPTAPAASARGTTPVRDITERQLLGMPDSAYMNDTQLAFFRHRLLRLREEGHAREVSARQLLNQSKSHTTPPDRAPADEVKSVSMGMSEREAQLLGRIDEALARIRSRDYGYCTQTGDPIGIERLLARPTASVCDGVKERREREALQRG